MHAAALVEHRNTKVPFTLALPQQMNPAPLGQSGKMSQVGLSDSVQVLPDAQ
jgi:hypothetical protein